MHQTPLQAARYALVPRDRDGLGVDPIARGLGPAVGSVPPTDQFVLARGTPESPSVRTTREPPAHSERGRTGFVRDAAHPRKAQGASSRPRTLPSSLH